MVDMKFACDTCGKDCPYYFDVCFEHGWERDIETMRMTCPECVEITN